MGKLLVNGDIAVKGSMNIDGNIIYTNGASSSREMIRFMEGNANGAGIIIGNGALVVVGSGESAGAIVADLGLTGPDETLHLSSDGTIYFHTNCQKIADKKTVTIDSSGAFSGTIAWDNITNKPTSFPPESHTHSYLPLSGGAMTGNIGYANGSYTDYEMIKFITGGSDGAGIVIGGGGLVVLGCGESASNLVTAAGLAGNTEETHITSDGTIYFHTNCQKIANRKTVTIDSSGAFSGTIAWGNVTGKPSTFPPESHTHSYLPLSGGTVTGTLILSRTTDAAGTSEAKPALIIGGTATTAHIQIDNNEILAKSNGTTPTTLYLNKDGGLVSIGSDGLKVGGSLKCSKTIVKNYGSTLPSSGTAGEIFYKT